MTQLTPQKKEALAFFSSLGHMEGGDMGSPVLGIPSLQSSSVSLSEGDGTEEKEEFPKREHWVEETREVLAQISYC